MSRAAPAPTGQYPPARLHPRARLLWAAVALLGLAGLAAAWSLDATRWPEWRADLLAWREQAPALLALGLFMLFTLLSALALPGCSVLALAVGAFYGWVVGTLLVLLASTVGATLSFLAARWLLRDRLRLHYSERLAWLEAALARDGAWLLFSLRMVPLIPFALINPLMGLTTMRTRVFFAVSAAGMLLGSAAYVHAGMVLGSAASWRDLLSLPLLALLTALAVLPWLLRRRLAREPA